MDVQVRYHHMPKVRDLGEHIKRRLALDLDRFERRIRRIVMHIYDLNGPRGGVDKKCLALVELKPSGNVAFELTDANPFTAVDKVSDRLKERLHREFDRRRSKRRMSCELSLGTDQTGGNDGH